MIAPVTDLPLTALSRGLELLTDDSLVTGLVLRDASVGSASGIVIEGDDNVVPGNFIGVTANGEQSAGNSGYGVQISSDDNVGGGGGPRGPQPDLGQRNPRCSAARRRQHRRGQPDRYRHR